MTRLLLAVNTCVFVHGLHSCCPEAREAVVHQQKCTQCICLKQTLAELKLPENFPQSVQTLCFVAADTAIPYLMYLGCRHAAAAAEEPH